MESQAQQSQKTESTQTQKVKTQSQVTAVAKQQAVAKETVAKPVVVASRPSSTVVESAPRVVYVHSHRPRLEYFADLPGYPRLYPGSARYLRPQVSYRDPSFLLEQAGLLPQPALSSIYGPSVSYPPLPIGVRSLPLGYGPSFVPGPVSLAGPVPPAVRYSSPVVPAPVSVASSPLAYTSPLIRALGYPPQGLSSPLPSVGLASAPLAYSPVPSYVRSTLSVPSPVSVAPGSVSIAPSVPGPLSVRSVLSSPLEYPSLADSLAYKSVVCNKILSSPVLRSLSSFRSCYL